MQMVDNLPMNQALGVMDALVSEVIKGLVDALTRPSLINLDFADLKTIIKQGGISTILYAENADPKEWSVMPSRTRCSTSTSKAGPEH